MEEVVQTYVRDKTFMGAVLVARGGDVLLSKGYGFGEPRMGDPQLAGDEVPPRLGDEAVHRRGDPAARGTRQALARRPGQEAHARCASGLGQDHDLQPPDPHLRHPELHELPRLPVAEASRTRRAKPVATLRDKPLEFEPGEKMNYSNSGYLVLGYVIEKISGGSYAKFVHDNIFKPLGMKDSGYDSNSAIIPRRAAGYSRRPPVRSTPASST